MLQYLFCNRHGSRARRLILREEKDPHANPAPGIEFWIEFPCFTRKKRRGQLYGNAGAVAARTVRINCTAMREASETLQCLLDDAVRGRFAQLGDKPDSTCVMLFPLVDTGGRGDWQISTHV